VLEQATAEEDDFVVVEDMSKGLFTPELVGQIIEWSDLESQPLLVDPERGEDYARYTGADYIVPNRAEAEAATGIELDGVEAYRRAASQLLDTLNLEAAIIKLDRDGIFFATAEGEDKHVPTTALEVADVTGAGDMVAASVSFALAAGRDLSEAVTLANVAAGIEVSRQGATAVSRKDLQDELQAQADPSSRKIKGREEIKQIVEDARSRGQTVAFTNGCFDLLHLGHVELIRHAGRQADLLVVATNTDRSTKELKGPDRPINTEDVRTRILAALSDVDYVVLFDEKSVLPLIKELRPDVLVKGGDYGKEGVVGHDFVESYGGRVELAPRVEGLSTTELVERIARNHGNDGA
jgi:D-beta-D-heptose 7-phosphate kinase/D-beta-D-heptose 1-phosphate adenosyltransferase